MTSLTFFDLELTERDVLDLTGPDPLAAFFARLGYRTEARIEQTPANLGIRSEEMLRDIRSIQLIAEQEDGFQVYLLELRTVKIAHRQHLARAFRDRAGIFLFFLGPALSALGFALSQEPPKIPATLVVEVNKLGG